MTFVSSDVDNSYPPTPRRAPRNSPFASPRRSPRNRNFYSLDDNSVRETGVTAIGTGSFYKSNTSYLNPYERMVQKKPKEFLSAFKNSSVTGSKQLQGPTTRLRRTRNSKSEGDKVASANAKSPLPKNTGIINSKPSSPRLLPLDNNNNVKPKRSKPIYMPRSPKSKRQASSKLSPAKGNVQKTLAGAKETSSEDSEISADFENSSTSIESQVEAFDNSFTFSDESPPGLSNHLTRLRNTSPARSQRTSLKSPRKLMANKLSSKSLSPTKTRIKQKADRPPLSSPSKSPSKQNTTKCTPVKSPSKQKQVASSTSPSRYRSPQKENKPASKTSHIKSPNKQNTPSKSPLTRKTYVPSTRPSSNAKSPNKPTSNMTSTTASPSGSPNKQRADVLSLRTSSPAKSPNKCTSKMASPASSPSKRRAAVLSVRTSSPAKSSNKRKSTTPMKQRPTDKDSTDDFEPKKRFFKNRCAEDVATHLKTVFRLNGIFGDKIQKKSIFSARAMRSGRTRQEQKTIRRANRNPRFTNLTRKFPTERSTRPKVDEGLASVASSAKVVSGPQSTTANVANSTRTVPAASSTVLEKAGSPHKSESPLHPSPRRSPRKLVNGQTTDPDSRSASTEFTTSPRQSPRTKGTNAASQDSDTSPKHAGEHHKSAPHSLENNASPTAPDVIDDQHCTPGAEKLSKKLFPIFSGRPVLSPNKRKASPTRSSSPTPKRHRPLLQGLGMEQLIIDAGQKTLGPKICSTCGMLFSTCSSEDVELHIRHHANFLGSLRYTGSKSEIVVNTYHDGRVLLVRPSDQPGMIKKVNDVRAVVDRDLGFVDQLLPSSKEAAFLLFVSDEKRIVGCLIADSIKKAHRMLPPDTLSKSTGASFCSEETVPVLCGVNRIWTAPKWRRKKVATRLLDCLRYHFIRGKVLSLRDFAFSSPTVSGQIFAEKYTGIKNFLVYT